MATQTAASRPVGASAPVSQALPAAGDFAMHVGNSVKLPKLPGLHNDSTINGRCALHIMLRTGVIAIQFFLEQFQRKREVAQTALTAVWKNRERNHRGSVSAGTSCGLQCSSRNCCLQRIRGMLATAERIAGWSVRASHESRRRRHFRFRLFFYRTAFLNPALRCRRVKCRCDSRAVRCRDGQSRRISGCIAACNIRKRATMFLRGAPEFFVFRKLQRNLFD